MPDGAIVGPRLLAPREPLAGLVEMPGAGRQIGQAKPDTVIVRGRSSGLLERLLNPLNRIWIEVETPEVAQDHAGIARPLDIPVQDAGILGAAAGDPVEPAQEPPCLFADVAARGDGGLQTRFGESIAADLARQPAA